jgi:SAM-dependent methyltransferase
MVEALRLSSGDRVLDVGCGIGDPALALAMKVGPRGRVLAIDPVAEMIETAKERAASLGLENIEFEVCPVEGFDAAARSFDAVCGRWSFIFCNEVVDVFRRVRGWLRPNGRLATSTWTPLENCPGFRAINAAVNRQVALPPPDPAKPGMLGLSDPGQLAEALGAAGFQGVEVERVRLSIFARGGGEFWELMSQMGCSLNKVLGGLTPEQREVVQEEVVRAVEQFRSGDVLRIPALAQVGYGMSGQRDGEG